MKNRVLQAEELFIEQYKESKNLKALVRSETAQLQGIEVATDQLLNERSLDRAVGVNLDILGKIVVLDRPYTDPDPEDIFTFENPGDIGKGYTDRAGTQIGGVWIGLDAQKNLKFSDELYRFMLRAKIIYNTGDGTLKNMHDYARFVFGPDVEVTILSSLGAIDLQISRPIGRNERIVLEQTFPIAAGIKLRSISTAAQNGAFGFTGDARNGGFGDSDMGDENVGGRFMALVID